MNSQEEKMFLFDVDGTLYSQKKVRMHMMLRIFIFLLTNPQNFKEIIAVYYFRKYREKKEFKDTTILELCNIIAKKIKYEQSFEAIQKWMFEIPLDIIKQYEYEEVIEFIKERPEHIAVYSDYPVMEKLDILNINCKRSFVSGDEGLEELKPSKKAMKTIMRVLGTNNIIYVGDRDSKDKASAELVGIEYIDIKDFITKINQHDIIN